MSQIPMRTFILTDENGDKHPYIFRANHRAWHTLERITGRPIEESLNEASRGKMVGPLHELAYALCSTHRERMSNPPSYSDFLDLLPADQEGWNRFSVMLFELILAAFPPPEKKTTTAPTPKKTSRRAR